MTCLNAELDAAVINKYVENSNVDNRHEAVSAEQSPMEKASVPTILACALPVDWIGDDTALALACARWQNCTELALDTEFERVKTYHPILALVQVCDGERIALIDAPAIADWSAFAALMQNAGIEKIMHAAGEDVETIFMTMGAAVAPLYDTQSALALLNWGLSLGLAAMVQQYCAVSLSKEASRTDWLQRPLSDEQRIYAAADVQYLLPIWQVLRQHLNDVGRMTWLAEDGAAQVNKVLYPEPPGSAWRRLKQGFNLRGVQLAIARELFVLRETLARARNVPKTFIFRDETLLSLCEKAPRNWNALTALELLHPRALRVDGRAILDAIEVATNLKSGDWPAPIKRLIELPHAKSALQKLEVAVTRIAAENHLAAEWLLSKRQQELIILGAVDGSAYAPASWSGWRKRLLQEAVKNSLLSETIAVPDWL